ncbi:MAG: hypothetical protein KME32_15050 [Mojavia pulchra JT2-VF2]|uniref:Uncharacterized protein n=1 Tax=Mojavia pulchra JT2-VF2 TaxID=287848 RepID=A0A951PZD6_9NOST|nr:hypothetical protein [Mojavia pulchra JT2-VF2]
MVNGSPDWVNAIAASRTTLKEEVVLYVVGDNSLSIKTVKMAKIALTHTSVACVTKA